MIHKRLPKRTYYNTSLLTSDKGVQFQYAKILDSELDGLVYPTSDPPGKLKLLMDTVRNTSKSVIGLRKIAPKPGFSNDKLVVDLVAQRKPLGLQLNSNVSADRSHLRSKINRLQKDIQKRLNKLRYDAADSLVSTIATTNESNF